MNGPLACAIGIILAMGIALTLAVARIGDLTREKEAYARK